MGFNIVILIISLLNFCSEYYQKTKITVI